MVSSSPSAPRRLSRRTWTIIGVILLVVLVAAALIFAAAPSPQGGSTYSRSLTGYRGWYDYMLEQQRPVKRWRRSYDQLSGSGQTLIRIGKTPFLSTELGFDVLDPDGEDSVRGWIENGNTLILLQWKGEVTTAPFISQLTAEQDQVQIQTKRRYVSASNSAARSPQKTEIAAELQDQFGVVVWSQPLGQGTVISCLYPWLAANSLADQADNYRFLAALAQRQEGPIWVDEWMHGYRDPLPESERAKAKPQNFLDYLVRTPVAVMMAQIGFILLWLIWGHNHRFGALVTPEPDTQDASEQYIQALASTMNAARKTDFAVHTLGQSFQRTLATQMGLQSPYGQTVPDPEQISDHWSQLTGRPAQDLLELLEPSVRSDSDLLAWVTRVESLLRELP